MGNGDNIWVDGSYRANRDNHQSAGVGVYYGEGDPRNQAIPLSRLDDVDRNPPTSQRAELHAYHEGMKSVARDLGRGYADGPATIHTDSRYAHNVMTEWGHRWEETGYRKASGGTPANQDIIRDMRDTMRDIHEKYDERGWGSMRSNLVKGHSGLRGNEEADRLARQGADSRSYNSHGTGSYGGNNSDDYNGGYSRDNYDSYDGHESYGGYQSQYDSGGWGNDSNHYGGNSDYDNNDNYSHVDYDSYSSY
ncbi:hypothetical protein DICA2_C03268 [Diutina catenulata]